MTSGSRRIATSSFGRFGGCNATARFSCAVSASVLLLWIVAFVPSAAGLLKFCDLFRRGVLILPTPERLEVPRGAHVGQLLVREFGNIGEVDLLVWQCGEAFEIGLLFCTQRSTEYVGGGHANRIFWQR
jgi:hypothetical protein